MAGRKKLEKLKKTVVRPDGKIVLNASGELKAKVKKVCDSYAKNKRRVAEICKEQGWRENSFYRAISKYGDCKEMANAVGLGIRGDVEVIPAKIQAPKVPKDAYTIFDLPCRKEWSDEQKQESIKRTIEGLKIGMPFAHAVCYSGASLSLLKAWIKEEPGILDLFKKAESDWTAFFFKCLTRAADEASKRGKFGELVQGAERRYASEWGKIDSVDIVTRNEENEKRVLSLSAEQAKSTDTDFIIEEKNV